MGADDDAMICPRTPAKPLPKPGEVMHADCRPKGSRSKAPSGQAAPPIKVLTWNIERGYKLDAVIEEMRAIDADVIALQEIDIHCERSGWEDTGMRIATALGLNYVFLCEFEELWSPARKADTQGGGVHGNGILSKFDIGNFEVIEHTNHPVNWEDGSSWPAVVGKEPRHGRRLTLSADVATPQGSLTVYTAHLECFCGMLARMHQFSDILEAARKRSAAAGGKALHQCIAGDLNTLGNGVARLSPKYCNDHMRWWTIGYSEAEVWDQVVMSVAEDPSSPEQRNEWAARAGMAPDVCKRLLNPGFKDPFDAKRDITLDHPDYRFFGAHLMTGKLDWLMLRNAEVVSKSIGNHDFSKSDHKWLVADVHLTAQP
ncbi:hypothetical protein FOA52_015170 [Chlamydomonas sp. UWO 241]|nr:hypothetical protein FOA52_015170 [Chlamydomonas sp. UWO 241]